MSRKTSISHNEASARGWTRVDPKPWRKLKAKWRHRAGWRLEHCGHPTALWPWALFDALGVMHCTGAMVCGNPRYGTAWPDLRTAMAYVTKVEQVTPGTSPAPRRPVDGIAPDLESQTVLPGSGASISNNRG